MSELITGRNYDISQLFGQVFGYVAPPYPDAIDETIPVPSGTPNEVAGILQRVRGLQNGRAQFMPMAINGIQLDIEPLVSLEGEKTVVRTPINGGRRKGTVKELFAEGDWQIKIQGFLEAEGNEFPTDELQDLRDFWQVRSSLEIDCELLRAMGIQYIVLERLRLPEMRGVQNMQAFEISGYSDDFPERELVVE